MKTFYLIDGHAQLFRAYYAPFRPLTAPSGEPVKAVYVFTQLLLSTLLKERPDYLAVAFDVSDATTLRKDWYPAYKEHREESPEDLAPQFRRVRAVLEALGVPIFEREGYEADDLIATIARRLRDRDVELRIASKDKDLHQILTERVRLWDPSSGELITPESLREKNGYGPEQAVEIQTLTGDSVDNVPGAKGVGVKTAARLIGEHGDVDGVYAHLEALSPKLRENLEAHRHQVALTRRLVTLDDGVPMDFDLEACAAPKPSREALKPLFDELGFRSLLEQLPEEPVTPATAGPAAAPAAERALLEVGDTAPSWRMIEDAAALEGLVRELRDQPAFAVDTETTSLRAADADVIGYAFAWRAGEGVYLPVRSRTGAALDPERVAAAIRPVLADPGVLKVGQNLKYDLIVLGGAGLTLADPLFDTMVAASLLYPERRAYNMDDLARDLLGHTTIPISALIGKGKLQKSMLDVPLPQLAEYAAEDAEVTWRLYQSLRSGMDAAGDALRTLFRDLEMPLVRVLAGMERAGVALDSEHLRAYGATLEGRIEGLRHEAFAAAGREFNLESPKQLGEVLFDELGFPVVKRTKTGRSTDAEVLQTLAGDGDHPLPGLLLEYRELTKLLGTYLVPLPNLVSERTGRLHASFHQTGAATGRLSSSDPNIQNIPVRTEAGREIRRAFRAGSEDSLLMAADYSQVELRMLAHFSEDAELVRAFREGLDIHAYVASQVYGVPLSEVDADQRRVAKTVNFGIVYGQTAYGLARTLHIPTADAAAFIDAYKQRYAGLDRFLEACVAQAEEHGYVSTILGRRRPVPQVRSRNRNVRALGERLAINTVIQGSAADLIKVAMVRLHRLFEEDGSGARLLIQVHDELVVETPEAVADTVRDQVVREMTEALPLRVPLKVEVGVARNWLEGKG
ncbi:MAG TPA: DNA polymerase I [Trueperaceae bacterium]|nr:DNA polymerase I [Trueperaceae bacterium]